MGKIADFMNVGNNGGSKDPMMIKVFCLICMHEWLAFLPDGLADGQIGLECPKGCGMNGVPCEEDNL